MHWVFSLNEPAPTESLNAIMLASLDDPSDPAILTLLAASDIEAGEEIMLYYGADYERVNYTVDTAACQQQYDAAKRDFTQATGEPPHVWL